MSEDETQTPAAAADDVLPPSSFLIVDDDRVLRDRLARAFRDRGHEVETASGLAEAQEVAARFRPKRAVIDLRMPDGSGLELVRTLRAADDGIEIVVLTGYGSIATAIEAKNGSCVSGIMPSTVVIATIITGRSFATLPSMMAW